MTTNNYQPPTREQAYQAAQEAAIYPLDYRQRTVIDAVLALFQQPTPSAEPPMCGAISAFTNDPCVEDAGHNGRHMSIRGFSWEPLPRWKAPAEPVSIADMAPGTAVKDARGVIWYRGTGSWVAANGPGWPLEPVAPVVVLDVTPPSR